MYDVAILLPNQITAFADLMEALGNAGLNVKAAGFDFGLNTIAHLLVEDPRPAQEIAERSGWEVVSVSEAVLVNLEDSPGQLGRFSRNLASEGVVINAFYIVGHVADRDGLVSTAFVTSDPATTSRLATETATLST